MLANASTPIFGKDAAHRCEPAVEAAQSGQDPTEGGQLYTVPQDNCSPRVTSIDLLGATEEDFCRVPPASSGSDWGLRNPWQFSFDRETGDLDRVTLARIWRRSTCAGAGYGGGLNCWKFLPWAVAPLTPEPVRLSARSLGRARARSREKPFGDRWHAAPIMRISASFASDYCSGKNLGHCTRARTASGPTRS